jgi:hypothetical protein
MLPHVFQISPDKDMNFHSTTRALVTLFGRTTAPFTVSPEPRGFAVLCQLATGKSALYDVSVRRLAVLRLGFLQTSPRGFALALG